MAKGGGTKGEDGRADLGIGDDLDAEDVGEAGAAVVAEGAKDEILAFLVEDEDPRQHDEAADGRLAVERGRALLRYCRDIACHLSP